VTKSPTKSATTKLTIRYTDTDALVPYARNARLHSQEQVRQIADSIQTFGFNNPVLIDPEGGIIAGHGRVMAAKLLGLAQVPAITIAGLSEAQKRAYILADNKLALNASWDLRLLAEELEFINAEGFAASLIGFTDADMQRLSDDLSAARLRDIEAGSGEDEGDNDGDQGDEGADSEPPRDNGTGNVPPSGAEHVDDAHADLPPEMVAFSVALTHEDRAVILSAVAVAKAKGAPTTPAALRAICEAYIDANPQ
jgi:hypothetical protein